MMRRAAVFASRVARSRHGTILCYHGVEAAPPENPSSAHVSLAQFRDTLTMARAVAEPVPLRELIARQFTGRSTAGLFSVTFDDAYVSLLGEGVQNVLSSLAIPITMFVVTGASQRAAPFWWDRVETVHRLVSADAWAAFEAAIGLPDAYRTAASEPFGPLRPLRQWLLHRHAGRWPQEAEEPFAGLERLAGSPKLQRPMTFDELDAAVRTGRVDLGVHTVSHPVVPLLSDEDARHEIRECYDTLRERWPSTLPWLAAPFGLYDERTSEIARNAGLEGILTLHAVTLAHTSPVHGLPRMNVMEGTPAWKLGLRLGGAARLLSSERARRLSYPDRPGPD